MRRIFKTKPVLLIALFLSFICLYTQSLFAGITQVGKTSGAVKGRLDLRDWDFNKNGITRLDGEWEFYWNELLTPDDFSKTTETPLFFKIPGIWNNYEIKGKKLGGDGYGTFRLRILLPEKQPDLALYIQNFATSYRLWIDLKPCASNGIAASSEKESVARYIPQTIDLTDGKKQLTLTLQIANFYSDKGGPWNSIYIGPRDEILHLRDGIITLDSFILGLLFIIALYYIRIYFFRRKDPSYLYFGLVCLLFFLYMFVNDHSEFRGILLSRIDWNFITKSGFLIICAIMPAFISLIHSLYPLGKNRIIPYFFNWAGLLLCLTVIILPVKILGLILPFIHSLLILALLYMIISLISAAWHKQRGALIYLVSMIFFTFSAFFDIAVSEMVIPSIRYSTGIGLTVFILFQSYVLASRFTRSISAIETVSGKLHFDRLDLDASIDSLARQLELKANELRESEERYREMAFLLPTIIIETDSMFRITFSNQAGLKTLGLEEGKLSSGENLLNGFVHPDDRKRFAEYCQKIIKEENINFSEIRLIKKDGTKTTLLSKAAPIYKDGSITGIRFNAIDLKPLLSSVILPEESFFKNYRFSEREKEVLLLLMQGYKIKEIAEKLFIAEVTVKWHLSAIYAKLGVKNKIEFFELLKNYQRKSLGSESFIFSILSKLIKEE